MFFLTARRMLDEARRHLPALGALLDDGRQRARRRRGRRDGYADAPSISIDHGIMEKATGLRVVPGEFGWNDVGSWAALPALRAPDARGNVVIGGATLIDGDGNIVVADEGAPYVGVLGVRDLVVVVHEGRRAGDPEGPCAGCAPHRRGREAIRPRRSAVTSLA